MVDQVNGIKPAILAALVAVFGLTGCSSAGTGGAPAHSTVHLLNASYDPAFASDWKQKTGQTVEIEQSQGGSGKVVRIQSAGPVVRIELTSEEGESLNVELGHDRYRELHLIVGSAVYVRVKTPAPIQHHSEAVR